MLSKKWYERIKVYGSQTCTGLEYGTGSADPLRVMSSTKYPSGSAVKAMTVER